MFEPCDHCRDHIQHLQRTIRRLEEQIATRESKHADVKGYLKTEGWTSSRDIADTFSLGHSYVGNILRDLIRAGHVRREKRKVQGQNGPGYVYDIVR